MKRKRRECVRNGVKLSIPSQSFPLTRFFFLVCFDAST